MGTFKKKGKYFVFKKKKPVICTWSRYFSFPEQLSLKWSAPIKDVVLGYPTIPNLFFGQ
jgi:hypothetical protein